MTIKKYMLRFFILLLLNGMGLVFGMDAPGTQLRPIDKVFLLACEKNTDIGFSLKNGANWKSIDPKNGYTGLHYACMNNNLERVKWFLKKDWNLLNVISKNSADPINVAREYGHLEIVRYLLNSQFIYLCKNYSGPYFQSTAKQFFQRGANVNAQADEVLEPNDVQGTMQGFTPLLYACIDGEIEKAKFLLSNGADVNQKSVIGIFPLYVIFSSFLGGANESKRLEFTKLLLDHGADLNLTGPNNHGVLAAAVASNSIRCVKLLLNKGIDVNIVDSQGHNALYEAVLKNLENLVPMLFDAGVKPPVDIEGVSVVHAAAIKNNAPILKELITRGLDVNAVDKDGQTPLHYASERAGVEVIKMLIEAGAIVNAVDKNGKTPVMLAKTNPYKESLVYLQKQSRKHISAQKNVAAIHPPVASQKDVKTAQAQETKNPKKKKQTKKKKKKKELVAPVLNDEAHDKEDPWLRIVAESEAQTEKYKKILLDVQEEKRKNIPAQTEVKQPDIAPLETEPAPAEQLVESVQVPQLPKIKKPKKTLVERVQEKVVDTLITPKTKKSFADVAAAQQEKKTKKAEKRITDGNLEIAVPIDPQKQLMYAGYQENPLAKITQYSKHVDEKRNDPNDPFHNFSHKVEEELGYLAQQKVIKPATKKDSAKIQYTIPATVSFRGGNNIFPGEFEFIVQGEKMFHRVFIPKQKISKKKKQLMLPAPTGDNGGSELPK